MSWVNYLVVPELKLAFELSRDVTNDDLNSITQSNNLVDVLLEESSYFDNVMDKPVRELTVEDTVKILSFYLKATQVDYCFREHIFINYFSDYDWTIVHESVFHADNSPYKDFKTISRFNKSLQITGEVV